MGANLVRRLLAAGHDCVVFDTDPDAVAALADEGAVGGVDPDSDTETFAAVAVEIASWRWAGVPFHIRAGKAMAATVTEAVVEFRPPPRP